jgi:hypothetical protein
MGEVDPPQPMISVPLQGATPDWERLANAVVPGNGKTALIGRRAVLSDHLRDLTREFAGESQLLFYHAALTVLIRRGIDKDAAIRQFESLWRERQDDLLHGLTARWLVSACDTIMDCSTDPYERAIAFAGSCFMNTIKLYETELLCVRSKPVVASEIAYPRPLFDGMTSFAVGRGDMVHNLRSRMSEVCRPGSVAAAILQELVRRADRSDTVYRRFAELHADDATRWVV